MNQAPCVSDNLGKIGIGDDMYRTELDELQNANVLQKQRFRSAHIWQDTFVVQVT